MLKFRLKFKIIEFKIGKKMEQSANVTVDHDELLLLPTGTCCGRCCMPEAAELSDP